MTKEGKPLEYTSSKGFTPLRDVILILRFFTRLPIPISVPFDRSLAQASWAIPLAGVVVGGVGGMVACGAILIGAPNLISIILGLVFSIMVSGALHEDGLADVADGFGGGMTRNKKLHIMRDSRIGTYGVLALVFSVGLRAASLSSIATSANGQVLFAAFLAGAVFSRGLLPCVMYGLPNAREDGLSKSAGRPGLITVLVALFLSTAGVLAMFVKEIIIAEIAIAVSLLTVFIFCVIAKRQIGGQTGDVIGAAQQFGEVTFLISLSIIISSVQ